MNGEVLQYLFSCRNADHHDQHPKLLPFRTCRSNPDTKLRQTGKRARSSTEPTQPNKPRIEHNQIDDEGKAMVKDNYYYY